ncbi:MAG: class I SAM-dependent methyltransferase [Candidatus Eremiobacteraeota bacterium]|nr:class I SAM-dependent methyltransferase [Candidatus Eremiobacteraeota bacterium]
MRHDWEENYQEGDTPWDSGQPELLLVEAVETGLLPPGRALELGCGTGTDAGYLQAAGYQVTGVDLSPTAIEQARRKVPQVTFGVLDVVLEPLPEGPFDLVFDRGCFHVFAEAEKQARFAEKVASVLRPHGAWLSLIGSTEGAPREHGPPRRNAREIVAAIEPALELVSLRAAAFHDTHGNPPAWFCLSRRRDQPAQPSSAPF